MKTGRALVTGAAGFIGSHLVDRLLAEGYEVTGIDSFEDFYPRFYKEASIAEARKNSRFKLLEANILDLAHEDASEKFGTSLGNLVAGADCIFHLAAQAGVRSSWSRSFRVYTENNVLATQLILEACKDTSFRKFVYASSSSVYGDADELPIREDAICCPISPYGVTKVAGENLCQLYWKNFGVPSVSLRYFTVYGPRQRPDMAFHRFIRAMLDGQKIEVYGDGYQTRDFTYISDIIDGTLLALSAPDGSILNLGGGSRVSLLEALHVLEEVTGLKPQIDLQLSQAGDVRNTWASLDRASSLIDYKPKVSLETGLASEFSWLQALAKSEITLSGSKVS